MRSCFCLKGISYMECILCFHSSIGGHQGGESAFWVATSAVDRRGVCQEMSALLLTDLP